MAALPRISEPPPGGWRYLIALGSNMRHPQFGAPERVLGAAVATLAAQGVVIERVAPVMRSAPVGPSWRRYANGAAVVRSDLAPPDLLAMLKHIEQVFGRRRGRRWGSRVIDLDIVLWDGGIWRSHKLCVPHIAYRSRDFVLRPALAVAADWRDPITQCTIRHHHSRLTRRRPAPRGTRPSA